MANKEHLARLKEAIEKKDIKTWNKWRQEYPDVKLDFSEENFVGAYLRSVMFGRANLSGANFTEANLTWAYLKEADLSKANLYGINLSKANLCKANLSQATLYEAILNGVNLNEANLSEAKLCEAVFSYADLRKADLRRANLSEAHLRGVDLGEADICWADFSFVEGLEPSQIKSAKNWESAYYSQEMLESLGLPPDHNEKLRKAIEQKQPGT